MQKNVAIIMGIGSALMKSIELVVIEAIKMITFILLIRLLKED